MVQPPMDGRIFRSGMGFFSAISRPKLLFCTVVPVRYARTVVSAAQPTVGSPRCSQDGQHRLSAGWRSCYHFQRCRPSLTPSPPQIGMKPLWQMWFRLAAGIYRPKLRP